jgi:oligosaccharyltransferase complex subunit gamma
MLDFVNPRTECNVFYRPTLTTMIAMFFLFILVTVVGVVIYTQLQFLWTHWVVWFIGVILIYITCISGVVFDIIHNVPFIGRDQKTGEPLIFSDGVR